MSTTTTTKKRLLIVSDNGCCRCLLAKAVAINHNEHRLEVECAAAGRIVDGKLTCDDCKEINPCLEMVVRARLGDDATRCITNYRPQGLTLEMAKRADYIVFMGRKCLENARSCFPEECREHLHYYCCYKSKLSGEDCCEVPNPLTGDNWRDYYTRDRPDDVQECCRIVLDSMIKDWQPILDQRLFPSTH